MKAVCMKCKKKVEIDKIRQVVMKNGRQAVTGSCAICGTKVFRMLPKEMYF